MDKRIFAFVSINDLRNNIDTISIEGSVPQRYIKEYHDSLDILEAYGIDIDFFRIPDSEIKRRYLTFVGKVKYTDAKYAPKALLIAKIDALLTYLKINNSSLHPQGSKGR